MRPGQMFVLLWVGWAISWIVAATWSAPVERQAAPREAWLYRVVILLGAILLWHVTAEKLGARRLWHVGYDGAYALAGVAFLGIAFAWWARIALGALWSSAVTRKADHRIIDTGPYALVRHPIYTGLGLATLATAAASATWPGLLGCAFILFGFTLKARVEERFLAVELGQEAYGAYRRRVPMLVPFGGWRRL